VFGLLFTLLWVAVIVGWILMLVDAIQREEGKYPGANDKVIWILVLVLAGWIGAILYYILIYKKYGKA
jgi:prolipoprotein diacylglyceryltransferase